jgi:hypothetical protein
MEEIFKQVQSDPDVQFSAADVEKWMEDIDDTQYNYLEGKTSEVLQKEKEEVFATFSPEMREKLTKSLAMYRFVDTIQEMRLGRYCRWMTAAGLLHGGGYLIKVSFSDKGVYLLCEKMKKYKMMVKMDEDTIVFQKMTAEEWVVVMANDYSAT